MGNTPSFNDRFARRSAPGGIGFGVAPDHFRKSAPPPPSDAFRPIATPKPPKRAKQEKLEFAVTAERSTPKSLTAPPARDPFARAPLHPPKVRTQAAPAAAGDFYNPFGRPPAAPAEPAPAPTESPRAPLHVVPSAPAEVVAAKPRPAGRSSSLVLVSGASAISAAETLEAPPPPRVEKSPPPPGHMVPIAPVMRRRSGGGGPGGAPPGGGTVKPRRGFNQDDLFGIIFGIAVIAFLIMWLMRTRTEDVSGVTNEEGLVGVQSAANLAPPPQAAPLTDPFGNAPVDLRPTGPIPEPLPEPEANVASAPPAAAPATPPAEATVAPPVAAAPPVVTPASPPQAAAAPAASISDRKMNGWFCTASSKLTTASRAALEAELVTFADVFAGKELVVRGYADTRGSTEFNALLAGERAKVVADFLRTKGLRVAEYTGIGELDGLDDNQNCPNQRRVDVWVKGGPAAAPSRACAPEPEAAQLVCS